jgi:two-component system response regulator YesN
MWTIAIVDDERQVLSGMQRIIPWQELGAEPVGEAMDGAAGLKLVLDAQPDIVITDIYMPVQSGLDMIEELRKQHYDGKIIILSGYSDFEYARQAMRLGVDDYLTKPVTVQTLREVLGKAIDALEQDRAKALETDEWRRKLLVYEPFVEQERLKALVSGVGGPDGIAPSLAAEGKRQYRVAVVEIVRNERMEGLRADDWNLFRFAVGNIAKELAEELGLEATAVELYGHQMALLLRFAGDTANDDSRERTVGYARRLIRAAAEYLRIRLQIGIGGMKALPKDIAASTEEAFQGLHEKLCVLDEAYPVFIYKSKRDEEARKFAELRPTRYYHEIASALRQLQQETAAEAVEKLTARLCEWPGLTAAEVQRVAREVWTICKYLLHEANIPLEEAFPSEDVEKELAELITPQRMRDWALAKVSAVCARFGKSENVRHKQAIDFMLGYVHEHYAEDLRLADLAEKVYISRNYLSNIFRSATGETFNDYVTKVRMEKAKSMIAEGKLMVYEIAEKVGYKNVPYFTTLFKKHTGRNPSEFARVSG